MEIPTFLMKMYNIKITFPENSQQKVIITFSREPNNNSDIKNGRINLDRWLRE